MENQIICTRCERPVAKRYWMHVFKPDGSEEKTFCGQPAEKKEQVVVFIDEKCPTGWKGRLRYRDSCGRPMETEVEDNLKSYKMSDLKILKKGDRFLMVMPVL